MNTPDAPLLELEPEPPPPTPPMPPFRRLDLLVLIAILAVLGGARFARLDEPGEMIPLDEKHYVPDARDVIRYGTESDTRVSANSGAYVVHPPIGKLLIAAGIRVFGDGPFGWRVAGAALGTLALGIAYALARRLWRSSWWAAAAATLLGLEGLWFVQSRVAMLDIFAAVFVLAGVWLVVEDRDRPSLMVRTAAAASFGLAIATKWSVVPLVLATVAIWVAMARPRAPRLAGGLALFLIVPAAVYAGSYVPWLTDEHRYLPPACETVEDDEGRSREPTRWEGWWCYQGEMAGFHRNLDKLEPKEEEEDATAGADEADATPTATSTLEPGHPYFSHAWSWPWIGRPVVHFYEATGEGAKKRSFEVLGLPNPAIWWVAFFVAVPALAWLTIRRDSVAATLLLLIGAGWGPYLAADLPAWAPNRLGPVTVDVDRPVFLFYATPFVPFLVLAVVHVLVRLVRRFPDARTLVGGYIALCAGTFAFFYPVLSGAGIPHEGGLGWTSRMWFGADCGATDMIRILCWI